MLSSIKGRLALWFFIIFSIIFSTFGVFLYHNIEKILIGSVDSHLHSEVQLILGLLDVDAEEGEAELSEAAVGEYALPLSGHYYQLTAADGTIITLSPSLSIVGTSLPLPEKSRAPLFSSVTGPDKGPMRLLIQTFELPTGELTIQAGESLEETHLLLERFKNTIALILPVCFLVSIAGIILITRLSLKRVDLFARKIETITEKNLAERVDEVSLEQELKPLAASFNTMMGRIEKSFETQRRFLADASHDLKTPQSVIKTRCDVTLSKEREKDEYIEALETIRRHVDKMTDLTNRILKVSALESDTLIMEKEELDLARIIDAVVKDMKSMRNVSIDINGEEKLKVCGDRAMLTEMFSNLIGNALKYNVENGSVDVKLLHQGNEAVVSVKDSGIGIAADKLGRIFDRFYRADKSRGVTEGSGLGLSIVKAIIENHGGRIEAVSEPGSGSCFSIYLPAIETPKKGS
ncbi:MAG: ATP-binding protein [bacterium]|nr:ATP-binding protein [bacterium]